ncbi:MAG: hypothetical protein KKH28_03525 [Elusimicrobia bacterium]|nr:hypothetical protein [Elusimicrobiota bacterium]
MAKIKAFLLDLAVLLAFANFLSAADQAAVQAASGNGAAALPAFELLISATPQAGSLEDIAVPKAEPAPPPAETEKAIKPGRDLTPEVEDPLRIKAILKLVSDIYNQVHLPYPQDGSTFKNREGKLPKQPPGYYKEYTLLTGNAPHTVVIGGQTWQVSPDLGARGSERVVIGGGELLYYTPDHYAHFIRLTVVR